MISKGELQESESESEVAQLCPTLWGPMYCRLPDISICRIFLARVPECAAISFSRGSSRPRNQTQISHIAGRCFILWSTRDSQESSQISPFLLSHIINSMKENC